MSQRKSIYMIGKYSGYFHSGFLLQLIDRLFISAGAELNISVYRQSQKPQKECKLHQNSIAQPLNQLPGKCLVN
jgi:hypothetical protein